MKIKRGLNISKTFIISIFFFFFLFFFLNEVSAVCIWGIGNTCAFVPSTLDELSSNLLVSYRFEQPFDLGANYRVWNSAGLQNGIIYPDSDVSDFLVTGLNNSGFAFDFNRSSGTNLSTQITAFNVTDTFSFSTFTKGKQGSIYAGPLMNFNNKNFVTEGLQDIFEFGLYPYFDRRLQIYYTTNGDIINIETTNPIPDTNDFQQVGFSYDGTGRASGFKIYVNGEQVPFKIVTNEQLTNSIYEVSNIFIGVMPWSSVNLNTTLDNVLIYNKVKSAIDFKTLYNDGKGYTSLPFKNGNFRQEYNIGGRNLTTKGYNLNLDNYYKDYSFVDLHYYDLAFLAFKSAQALKPFYTSDCISGDIFVCLNSTDEGSNFGNFHTNLLFTSPIGDQVNNNYFESFYLTLANPFGYRQASFNVNITSITLPPYNTGLFKSSYDLDLYPLWESNSTNPNLVLKMNDYFSNAKNGNLRFYDYININFGSLNITIPKNNTYYTACDETQKVVLCYYNYEALNLNDIWLVFYSQDFKQAYKVNVNAGNSYGFANQSFGITSGGATYTGQTSSTSGTTSISLKSLALGFIGLFPEASGLSTIIKYAYLMASIVLIMGLSLFFLKTELGIILGTILSILTFIFFIFIDYISIVVVILLVLISLVILGFKFLGGGTS